MAAYTPTTWVNDSAPALSAANLNKLTNEIESQAAALSISHSLPNWIDNNPPALTDAAPLNEMERVTELIAIDQSLSYTKTVWSAGWTPARNAANFNKLEQAAEDARTAIDAGNPAPPSSALRFTPLPLTNATTINVTPATSFQVLDDSKDYIINFGDYISTAGPSIIGGRRVWMKGRITINASATVNPFGLALWPRNGAYHYLEGVHVRPRTSDNQHLHDGILVRHNGTYPSNVNSRIIIQNTLIGPVSIKLGASNSEHADVLQFQSDYPGQLWTDRVTGLSDYSGIMMSNFTIGLQDHHRVNIRGVDVTPTYSFATGVGFYQGIAASRVNFDDFWINPWSEPITAAVYPSTSGRNISPTDGVSAAVLETDGTSDYLRWPNSASGLIGKLRSGIPSGGDFVDTADVANPSYTFGSQGYQ